MQTAMQSGLHVPANEDHSGLMTDSPLSHFERLPGDPILDVGRRYKADLRSDKANLGVGIYLGDDGSEFKFSAIRAAEVIVNERTSRTASYLLPTGYEPLCRGLERLVFGRDNPICSDGTVVSLQTLGGTGALAVAARTIQRKYPNAEVLISAPTWPNHRGIFEDAGLEVRPYRYYHRETHQVDFEGMKSDLFSETNPGRVRVIILHACCHNPTGADLNQTQWQEFADGLKSRAASNIVVFDNAYQGFGTSLEEDAFPIRAFSNQGIPLVVAVSLSKSMGLYGERVGALIAALGTSDQAQSFLTQAQFSARRIWSSPAAYGGRLAGEVLNNKDLYATWESDYRVIHKRVLAMRNSFVDRMNQLGIAKYDHVRNGQGLFALLQVPDGTVEALEKQHAIYSVRDTTVFNHPGEEGMRVNLAGLNSSSLPRFCQALAGRV
ncbi:MAG: hypothetical protein DCC75_00600 [Proteobacteria bacterium]|nr:MAG: hypothetical protein DCC75_00600 [Pseudomonadota bacterium]